MCPDGIGVLHPEAPPFADHHAGVPIQTEEESDHSHTVLNGATYHDSAVTRDIAGEQQVDVFEVPGEQGPTRDPAYRDPASTLIRCIHIVLALGIVELRCRPLNDDVAVGLLPVINAGLPDRWAADRERRD